MKPLLCFVKPQLWGVVIQVCIIPARGGSKRIPRKNVKFFCGKPIVAYSIEAALKSGCFDRVLVSTDDAEIVEIAKKYGAEAPFVRPPELADDFASLGGVVSHALDWLKKGGVDPDYVCLLFATAPFIEADTLKKSFESLLSHPEKSICFGVTEFNFPIQRAIKILKDGSIQMFQPEHFSTRSQDLEKAYHDAGQFSWSKVRVDKPDESPWGPQAIPFVLPSYKVQDIDTPDDWIRAEAMYKALQETQ